MTNINVDNKLFNNPMKRRSEQKPKNYRWTKDEVLTLRSMARANASYEEIGKVIGRTATAVAQKAHKEGITNLRQESWTLKEEAYIIQNSHRPPSELAKELDRTVNSVQKMISHMRKDGRLKRMYSSLAVVPERDREPLSPEKPNDKIYALYEGDRFICSGTRENIAKMVNRAESMIRFYGTPTQAKRNENVPEHKRRYTVYLGKVKDFE